MTDIQKARDVLKKWRMYTSPDPWTISGLTVADTSGDTIADYEATKNLVARHAAARNCMLIVGTAGNPDLLDAIDAILQSSVDEERGAFDTTPGTYIAAAIITADQRMQQ